MTQEAQLKAYTVADYELAERLVDASNVVTCDGYYELDIKKVAQTLANANTRIESGVVAETLLAVVNATRAYLPPDGISEQECINRILEATDNPKINPVIAAWEASK
jgi:hypothetical protein